VGKYLTTSAIDGDVSKPQLITSQYKKSEDNIAQDLMEAISVDKTALVPFTKNRGRAEVTYPAGGIHAGTDLELTIAVPSGNSSTVPDIAWRVRIIHYNGKGINNGTGMIDEGDVTPKKSANGILQLTMPSQQYARHLRHGATIAIDILFQTGDDFMGRVTNLVVPVSIGNGVKLAIIGDKTVKRCTIKPHFESISFVSMLKNPFKAIKLEPSTLNVEIAGMDRTPELDNPDWMVSVPGLEPNSGWSKRKVDVPISHLACGAHEIVGAWVMEEFAEGFDATASTVFNIDCSACSGDLNPHDESDDTRATGHGTSKNPGLVDGNGDDPWESTDGRPVANILNNIVSPGAVSAPFQAQSINPNKWHSDEHANQHKIGGHSEYGTYENRLLKIADPDHKEPSAKQASSVPGFKPHEVLQHASKVLSQMDSYIDRHPLKAAVAGAYSMNGQETNKMNTLASEKQTAGVKPHVSNGVTRVPVPTGKVEGGDEDQSQSGSLGRTTDEKEMDDEEAQEFAAADKIVDQLSGKNTTSSTEEDSGVNEETESEGTANTTAASDKEVIKALNSTDDSEESGNSTSAEESASTVSSTKSEATANGELDVSADPGAVEGSGSGSGSANKGGSSFDFDLKKEKGVDDEAKTDEEASEGDGSNDGPMKNVRGSAAGPKQGTNEKGATTVGSTTSTANGELDVSADPGAVEGSGSGSANKGPEGSEDAGTPGDW